mmetsp:Transcript_105125/g.297616  ORF Transcript_105125/g.297616 Transcript_105125/m.297616 type:complete len:225 (+) Transcript_105125:674-1348(+)
MVRVLASIKLTQILAMYSDVMLIPVLDSLQRMGRSANVDKTETPRTIERPMWHIEISTSWPLVPLCMSAKATAATTIREMLTTRRTQSRQNCTSLRCEIMTNCLQRPGGVRVSRAPAWVFEPTGPRADSSDSSIYPAANLSIMVWNFALRKAQKSSLYTSARGSALPESRRAPIVARRSSSVATSTWLPVELLRRPRSSCLVRQPVPWTSARSHSCETMPFSIS